MKRKSPQQQGFTLIEILIAVTLLAILALLAGPLIGVIVQAMELTTKNMNVDESAMVAFSRMSRETRRLRDDKGVVQATTAVFEFVDRNNNTLRYRLVGNTLMRRQGTNPESGLVDFLQAGGLVFSYFDDAGSPLPTPVVGSTTRTDIRRVAIQMTFQEGNYVLSIELQVRPSNLRHENERFF